jgi:hypothetical protein
MRGMRWLDWSIEAELAYPLRYPDNRPLLRFTSRKESLNIHVHVLLKKGISISSQSVLCYFERSRRIFKKLREELKGDLPVAKNCPRISLPLLLGFGLKWQRIIWPLVLPREALARSSFPTMISFRITKAVPIPSRDQNVTNGRLYLGFNGRGGNMLDLW